MRKLDPSRFVFQDGARFFAVTRVQLLDAGDNVLADSASDCLDGDWRVPTRYHAVNLGPEIPEDVALGRLTFDDEHNPDPDYRLPEPIRAPA